MKELEAQQVLPQLLRIEPTPALLKWICTVHDRKYVEEVKRSCQSKPGFLHSMDTVISSDSYQAACLAAGGALNAVDTVMKGKVKNAFCAVRPPGHHAIRNEAMGFCLFNNVAIAARYAQEKHKLAKILIIDWDVHHGNGTQDAFYEDPTVMYFSSHRYPFYPGTGNAQEKGMKEGVGYTINVPLAASSGDSVYREAYEEMLKPEALKFKPDFIFISAGFDAHEDDPLGGMRVTTEAFAELTRIVKSTADECCDGRIVSVLEGGYDLKGLADSVRAHVRILKE